MAKITLDISDKNLSTVLNILENLKVGLIQNISTNTKIAQGKYMSNDTYKQKVNTKKILEDEFISSKNVSTGKYLNPNEYKNRLKKGK
jgi:hypothetical protein